MFMSLSMTGTGLAGVLVWLLVAIGQYFGLVIPEADAVAFVTNVLGAVGIILAYWGQYRRKDLIGGIVRK